MALGDEDLDVFTSDAGEVILYEGVEVRALVDRYDEVILEGAMSTGSIGRVNAVTVRTSLVPNVGEGSNITVGGENYQVRQPLAIHGGKFMHLSLRSV